VNPFATGRTVNYLDASGSTNYHSLQVEFRQRYTSGMQFSLNYTLAHSLGISAQNGIQGQGNNIYYTDRNFRLNYGPSLFDIRHVVHASGTYDLPFGKGKKFLSHNRIADYTVGGWTIGTIISIQSGNPGTITGGYNTLNNTDSGVVFTGGTVNSFQSGVGTNKIGSPWVYTIDPKYIAANGTASASFLAPNTTPGTWGYRPYVWGPNWYNADFSLNKRIPIRESIRLALQGEFLNAFNHPTFGLPNLNIQSTSFGQTTGGPTAPRTVELRANIEF
jgi:hypothetical protein